MRPRQDSVRISSAIRANSAPLTSSNRSLDIRLSEIVSLEEQSFTSALGQGVGETIAIVQGGGMATAAEPLIGTAGTASLVWIDSHRFDASFLQKKIETGKARGAKSAIEDDRGFYESRRGQQPRLRPFKGSVEGRALGFV
jgi:hypothetical protein